MRDASSTVPDKVHPVNLSDIRFPRDLEADETAEAVRRALMGCTVRLWPGASFEVARITIGHPLEKALRAARLQGRIRFGFEAIVDRLGSEEKGIMKVRGRKDAPYGDRVSRLILFSNDGAERFYRHVETLLEANSPRLLGCLLDIDGRNLGSLITGKDRPIKIVMVEHKEAVSRVLRAMIADRNA